MFLVRAPGIDRGSSVNGWGMIYSFPKDPKVEKADVVIDLKKTSIAGIPPAMSKAFMDLYAMTFHPQFAENRYCYVCYILKARAAKRSTTAAGSRVSR